MVSHRLAGAPLDFAALRRDLAVPGEFSAEAQTEAELAARARPIAGEDRTDLPLVTIDPPGSMDLDQAIHIGATNDGGFVVSYAIADVASFVRPAGPLDAETQKRGETLYFPDARIPLHPPVLSEGAASLLPDEVRPAVLWQISLDQRGEVRGVDVRRAQVRSRQRLDYAGVQRALDDGTASVELRRLEAVGRLRLALARERHAINLDLPDQEVIDDGDGGWSLRFRQELPAERYNAQMSLLTGMCAAQLMLDGGVGILRTVPAPAPRSVRALRRIAAAMKIDWPRDAYPGDVLAGVDRSDPKSVSLVDAAALLLRGSSYVAFDGQPPAQQWHGGVGAPYAHVTAPLRRLVDRYASEICLAVHHQQPVPDWVRQRLPALPDTMREAGRRSNEVDRAVVDMVEAWLLARRVGDVFPLVVVDVEGDTATVSLEEPAVLARCRGSHLELGARITARLVQADVATRTVRFEQES
jgi:VacB/RNase II family 3'-5' exoribonuclease